MDQAGIDAKNGEFWNELCGTGLAKSLNITDRSQESLRRFDDAYFAMYPYLLPDIIKPERLAGKAVLEIGLGYGSVSQRIAQAGADYNGLDIAAGPVRMVNHRLGMIANQGRAVQGSALDMPFPAGSFDCVISIGCFHHTGNVQRCFDETFRVLRPGGTAILMVYNKYSLRHWNQWPFATAKELLRDCGLLPGKARINEAQRYAYDGNGAGQAAPETVFLSQRQLRTMLAGFEHVTTQLQNADSIVEPPFGILGRRVWRLMLMMGWSVGLVRDYRAAYGIDRLRLLSTIGRYMGLDVYVEARKAAAAPSLMSMANAA